MKSFLTLRNTKKNVTPIIGTTVSTVRPSFQSVMIRRMDVPIIKNTEEIRDAIAVDTKVFTASTSEVRFVRSFAGVALSI